jgi:hypothetical protein
MENEMENSEFQKYFIEIYGELPYQKGADDVVHVRAKEAMRIAIFLKESSDRQYMLRREYSALKDAWEEGIRRRAAGDDSKPAQS